jgi:hypothetical protein
MKPRRIVLLLSLAGVVVIGFFLLAELLTPNESPEYFAREVSQKESDNDSFSSSGVRTRKAETVQSTKLSAGRIPEPGLATQQRDEEEELAQEQAQEDEAEKEEAARDEEKQNLNEEQQATFNHFLSQLTRENWREARAELLSTYKNGLLPRNRFVENQFWSRVGEIGGKDLANELLSKSDPAFSKILEGWGKKNPQEVFDYFAELDLRSPLVQKYLEKTNFREYPFMDQLSNSLIEGLMHTDSSSSLGDFQVDEISKAIDFFKENDPNKAASLMREFSKRVVHNKDPEVLKEWIAHYDDPRLQGEAAGKVIESGTFDKDPASAAKFAMSLTEEEARRPALSAAYARLAGGVNGHDPNLTATQLIEMDKGHDRDFALNGFAHGLVRKDPEGALAWANEISNENFRKVVTKNISKRIKKEIPNARIGEE